MGYSHNVQMKRKRNSIEAARKAIQTVFDNAEDLAYERFDIRPPLVKTDNKSLIVFFNGQKEGLETFGFDSRSTTYNWCKTDREPYDIYVSIVLLILKHYYKKDINIGSDGFSGCVSWEPEGFAVGSVVTDPDGNWAEALQYVKDKFNIKFKPICTKIRGEGRYYDWELVPVE